MKNKLSFLIFSITSLSLLFISATVARAGSFVNFTNPVLSNNLLDLPIRQYFQGLWGAVFTIGIVLGILLFFIILIIGGIQWVTSGGDRAKLESARSRIREGLIGFVILLTFFGTTYVVEWMYNINLRAFTISPLMIGGLPLPTRPGPPPGGTSTPGPSPLPCSPGIYPNVASNQSCNQICASNGAQCDDIGTNGAGTGGAYINGTTDPGFCGINSGDCSTVMSSDGYTCGTTATLYTSCNCTCGGGASPTPTPAQCASTPTFEYYTCSPSGTQATVTFRWDHVVGTTQFRFQQDTCGAFNGTTCALNTNTLVPPDPTGGGVAYNLTYPADGQTRYWRVRVETANSNICLAPSPWSTIDSFVTDCSPILAGQTFYTQPGGSTVTFDWAQVTAYDQLGNPIPPSANNPPTYVFNNLGLGNSYVLTACGNLFNDPSQPYSGNATVTMSYGTNIVDIYMNPGSCQTINTCLCDLGSVTEDYCIPPSVATCTGTFSCNCQ